MVATIPTGANPMFTSLRLERFKGFKDAELKLGPFTVLIGANASGKSNIRDAFRFLHGVGRGYSLAEIIGEKYGEGGERVWTGIRGGTPEIAFAGASSFALEAEKLVRRPLDGVLLGKNQEYKEGALDYRIEVKVDPKRAISLVARERLWDREADHGWAGAAKKDRLNIHGIWSDGTKYDVPDQPTDRPFIYPISVHIWNFAMKPHSPEISDVLRITSSIYTNSIARMRFFDWSLEAIRQPSFPGQDVLSDNGRNLSSVLQAICRDGQGKRNLLSWITELTPMDAVDFEFPADPTGKVLATLVEKSGQRTTLASASDGTLRFLAFLAAFLGPHPSSFYFFEELENGIHPTRLSLLLDLVENQVKHKGIQVVATTHSPQLLGRLSEASLKHASLIYRLEDQPDSRIIRVLDMPHASEVITMNRLAHLLATGWFESTAYYMQPDPDDEKVASRPARRRRSGVSR
jgi:predicted ATPase